MKKEAYERIKQKMREKYQSDSEYRSKMLERSKENRRTKHRAYYLAYNLAHHAKVRSDVINYYSGGKSECACCGEKQNRFLSIDHINGQRGIARDKKEQGLNLYIRLRRENYPDGFQVLCHNCNHAKGVRGECPHLIETLREIDGKKPIGINKFERFRVNLRAAIINHYSEGKNACLCCGENHYEFLTLDHIDGQRGIIRNKKEHGASLYLRLRRENYPAGFQVLCFSCNFAKGVYGKCPHEEGE